jgi:hypothetical protein
MVQAQVSTYKPSYRFVGGSTGRYGRSDQSHAQRESARMRQWERRKDLIGSISTVGGLPWTRRSIRQLASEALGADDRGDPGKGDPCTPHMKAPRYQTAAASRNLDIEGPVSGSGGSKVKLKAQYTDPFETFVVPIKGKYVDGLLDFRKFHASSCSDRGWVTHQQAKSTIE